MNIRHNGDTPLTEAVGDNSIPHLLRCCHLPRSCSCLSHTLSSYFILPTPLGPFLRCPFNFLLLPTTYAIMPRHLPPVQYYCRLVVCRILHYRFGTAIQRHLIALQHNHAAPEQGLPRDMIRYNQPITSSHSHHRPQEFLEALSHI